jgi:hypothetical protein
MNDSVLKMKHHGLGTPGIKPVSIALVVFYLKTKITLKINLIFN